MKRLLLLTDDEIERILQWRASDELWTDAPTEEDDELAAKLSAARLSA